MIDTQEIAIAREAFANGFQDIALWEACGCSNCHLALLDVDARSISLDLLVAQAHTTPPPPSGPAARTGGA